MSLKLYIAPGSCSLAPHIALREAELDFTVDKIDSRAKKTSDGRDYYTVNPNGFVPALDLGDGTILTEVQAVLQYIADQAPAKHLMPVEGIARYRALQWLSFVSSELHKNFSPLFNPKASDEFKEATRDKIRTRFAHLDSHLATNDFLMGEEFTVVDCYAFTVATWLDRLKLDRAGLDHLDGFMQRVAARPHVHAARQAEGLVE